MNKATLVVFALAILSAIVGVRCVGSYQALNACTEFENRMDEAGHPPGSMSPTTEDTVREGIDKLAAELAINVDSADISLEPLTKENAASVSKIVGQAVQVAGNLRGHEIKGKILTVDVRSHIKRKLTNRECNVNRRLLLAGQ